MTLRWFLLPIAPSLTPATYKTPFVEPIARATHLLFSAFGPQESATVQSSSTGAWPSASAQPLTP